MKLLVLLSFLLSGCALVNKPERYTPDKFNQIKSDAYYYHIDVKNYECTHYLSGVIIPFIPGFLLPKSWKVNDRWQKHDEKFKIYLTAGKGNLISGSKIDLSNFTAVIDSKEYKPESIEEAPGGYNLIYPVSAQRKNFKLNSSSLKIEGKDVKFPGISYAYESKLYLYWGFPPDQTVCH